MKKRIMITGGSFSNKGAQSMLFTTVNEIKKRNSSCEIYFCAENKEPFDYKQFNFCKCSYDWGIQRRALEEKMNIVRCARLWVKLFENEVLGINKNVPIDGGRLLSVVDLVIDISGFALSNKIKKQYNEILLNTIRLAKKYGKPIILLPQSFGPFDYSEDKELMLSEIKDLIQYPKLIFAREKQGKEILEKEFGLKNVVLSSDLVLQSRDTDLERIFARPYMEDGLVKIKDNSVAVIPNKQCFRRDDDEYMYGLYKKIIELLMELKKNVYIIQHSRADRDICRKIKDMFQEENVCLVEKEYNCIDFDALVRKFDFVICSRYHGCVHSYRNRVPCIILGWAEKYQELADVFVQNKYVYDIEKKTFSLDQMLDTIRKMNRVYKEEKKVIDRKLKTIQDDNCFKCLDEYLS